MFMLTPAQGMFLTAGWMVLVLSLLLGVFRLLPRSRRVVPAYVTCPMLNQTLGAQVMRDDWTRACCQVVRCDALGRFAPVSCNQRCLRTAAPLTGV